MTAAALAFWRAPVASVDVGSGRVQDLPLVNRVPNLEAALKALLHNQRGSWQASGDRRYQLLFCAQLFGVGKTAFGKKLAEGLNAGVGGRLAYHRCACAPWSLVLGAVVPLEIAMPGRY